MHNVKGILFLDYVRMAKTHMTAAWDTVLGPEDARLLAEHVDVTAWYPMTTFERLGNAILRYVTGGNLFPVQLWGRYTASQLHATYPSLLAHGDPAETLKRFHLMRASFFDFEAVELDHIDDTGAQIAIRYHMAMPAEEAAAYQTMGFFEGLLGLAGATDISSRLTQRSWDGDPRTILTLTWGRCLLPQPKVSKP